MDFLLTYFSIILYVMMLSILGNDVTYPKGKREPYYCLLQGCHFMKRLNWRVKFFYRWRAYLYFLPIKNILKTNAISTIVNSTLYERVHIAFFIEPYVLKLCAISNAKCAIPSTKYRDHDKRLILFTNGCTKLLGISNLSRHCECTNNPIKRLKTLYYFLIKHRRV